MRVTWTLAFLATVLSACTSLAPWETLSFSGINSVVGALNAGDTRPNVLRRCVQAMNTYPACDYAFVDSNGDKVNIYDDLVVKLDAHGQEIEDLKPWVLTEKMQLERRGPNPYKFPYKMFLLTITPAIVLVVPADPRDDFWSKQCSTLLTGGCIQSQGFRGNAYWFRESPRAAEGSFWFTTEEPLGSKHSVGLASPIQQIAVGSALVELAQENGRWTVRRKR